MKLVVDSNVLVRAVMRDDAAQAAIAAQLLAEAEVIAVPTASLCEFVWVLRRLYRLDASDVAVAIEALLNAGNVETQRSTVEAGLDALRAGGDFADGVIAHDGRRLGGETFASFDRQAITLLAAQGVAGLHGCRRRSSSAQREHEVVEGRRERPHPSITSYSMNPLLHEHARRESARAAATLSSCVSQ